MLVNVTDIKGRPFWINPVHVKLLQQGKRGGTEIVLTYTGGWGTNLVIRVAQPIDEVGAQINTAMPGLIEFVPDDDSPGMNQAAAGAGIIT